MSMCTYCINICGIFFRSSGSMAGYIFRNLSMIVSKQCISIKSSVPLSKLS